MKVLVLGSGGREHALAWSVARSKRVSEIVCAPGNGGMAQIGRCVPVDVKSIDAMVRLAEAEKPALVVVGPEVPLSLGIVDALEARGIRAFGPSKAAAQLEASKIFAKQFMQRHQIPTANFAICTDPNAIEKTLAVFHEPIVVKADGLSAGKGVLICETKPEAIAAARGLFDGSLLGAKVNQIVVEEFLTGDELSFLCLSDGAHVTPLAPSQDHKRVGEGDTGLNTGGMGVYSTDAMLDDEMKQWLLRHVAEPTVKGMAAEGAPFKGVLYCGLMMSPRGPQVLEYNARFGDPETQAILTRLESDLVDALEASIDGTLDTIEMSWKPGAAACVIACSAGYPGNYVKGLPITGLDAAAEGDDTVIFHSGTTLKDGQTVTDGGRVLGVTATAASLEEALGRAYATLARIHFEGIFFRRDIGHRALKKSAAVNRTTTTR
jgi:phosphoribosylamine---glycine ligase